MNCKSAFQTQTDFGAVNSKLTGFCAKVHCHFALKYRSIFKTFDVGLKNVPLVSTNSSRAKNLGLTERDMIKTLEIVAETLQVIMSI